MTKPVLYRRMAAELRDQITRGVLRPGDHLPTERELGERYGVSRNTVRLAVSRLVNEGLVLVVPGRGGGTIVRDRAMLTYHASRAEQVQRAVAETDAYVSEVTGQGRHPTQEFSLRVDPAPAEIAERLEINEGDATAVRSCLRFVDGQPWSLQESSYPMDLAREIDELMSPKDVPEGTTRLLARQGHPQVAYRDEIIARMPTPKEVATLELNPGTPVVEYTRTGYTPDRAVRVTRTVLPADRNRIVYTLGDPRALDRADTENAG